MPIIYYNGRVKRVKQKEHNAKRTKWLDRRGSQLDYVGRDYPTASVDVDARRDLGHFPSAGRLWRLTQTSQT